MRTLPLLPLVLLLLLPACGGGGDGGGLSAAEQSIVDCTRVTVRDLARIAGQFERVLGGDVALVLDSGTRYDFTVSFDGTTMAGQVTFPQDPAGGIPAGEDVLLTFSLTGPLSGSGNVTLNFESATRASMRGGATLANTLGCSSSLVFFAATPLHVGFGRALAGPAPAAVLPGAEFDGTIGATITAFETTQFMGDLDIAATTQEARLDGTIGTDAFLSVFSLFPDEQQQAELVACLTKMRALHAALYATFEQLSYAIDDAGADLTMAPEVPGWTVTPVSASNATYEIDATRFGSLFTAGTIRGSVRLTRVNLETTAFWSWRINAEIGDDSVFGQGSRFYEIAVDDGTTNRRSGAGTLRRGDCEGSFDDEGLLTVRSAAGPHTLALDLDDGTPVAARLDGIPVPLSTALPP